MITYEADKTLAPHQNLANAIVAQACDDYRKALRGKGCDGYDAAHSITAIRKFFRSEFYKLLTKVDGEHLIEKLDEEYRLEKGGAK